MKLYLSMKIYLLAKLVMSLLGHYQYSRSSTWNRRCGFNWFSPRLDPFMDCKFANFTSNHDVHYLKLIVDFVVGRCLYLRHQYSST